MKRLLAALALAAASTLSLLPPSLAASPVGHTPAVIAGRAAAGTSAPLSRGATVPPRAALNVANTLVVRMPDGTLARVQRGSKVTFDGLSEPGRFSVEVARGEIALDASHRRSGTKPLWFELRTPLHTLISFRALVGVVIVDGDHDRIACERCSRGDFLVSSFDKRLALTQPGQVAIVTADGGLLGGVLPLPSAQINAAALQEWVVRSISVTVRAKHGDRPYTDDACVHVPVELRIFGGRAPFAITAADPSAVQVRTTANPAVFELAPALPAEVRMVDAAGRSAAVRLRPTDDRRCAAPLAPGPE